MTSPSNSEQKQNIKKSQKDVEANNSDEEESSTNPSIGDTLMNDIDSFLHKSGIQHKTDLVKDLTVFNCIHLDIICFFVV